MNRKIAVIVAGIEESYQSNILTGIQSAASEYNFNCYIFIAFNSMKLNRNHDAGEMNIFNLPDFKKFDGAILLTNTIGYKPVVDEILQRIKEAGIPAVSMDNKVEGLIHIGIDNRSAMKEITKHFIQVHKFTKFNYISGPQDNPESSDRLAAFLEVLDEYNLTIEPDRIFYGDFRGDSAKEAIDKFIQSGMEMPQAIICANDVMAAAAVNQLHNSGIKIPDEIAVSGFDDVFDSYNLRVELTTVKRPLIRSGKLACKMLEQKFNNCLETNNKMLNMTARFSESCGCKKCESPDAKIYKEANIANFNRIDLNNHYMSIFNILACDLSRADNFTDYINSLKKFVKFINPGEFYFCLNKNWDLQSNDIVADISEDEIIPENYENEIIVSIAYSNGKFLDIPEITIDNILPDISDNSEKSKYYYIVPLHFRQRCFGYLAINDCPLSLHNALFQAWCITINNSLENIRKINALDCAVKKLKNLYIQDTFSGVYNRNGFVNATNEIFRDCARESRNVMLMFLDLDGLKVINDTYGHAVGDEAIRAIAGILARTCINGEIFCRFGGDEFIVFAADYNDDDAKKLTADIQENIKKYNKAYTENDYTLSASTGYVIAVPKVGEDLFLFVTEADKKMYETKREKKSKYLRN